MSNAAAAGIAIGASLLYTFACLGSGALLLALIKHCAPLRHPSHIPMTMTAFLLGQGFFASLWILLAVPGWFSPPVVATLIIVAIAVGFRWVVPDLIGFFRSLQHAITSTIQQTSWLWRFAILLLVALVATYVVGPLFRSPWGDGSAFYMVIPKIFASSHHLGVLPRAENLSQLGFFGEMHYAAMMSIANGRAAHLFMEITALSAAFMLVSLASLVGLGTHGKWIVLAVFFSSTTVTRFMGSGKIDLFVVAMGLAAFYWAIHIKSRQDIATLVLTGLFAGFAVIAKLSYAATFLPSLLLLIVWRYVQSAEQPTTFATLKSTMSALLIITICMLPPVLTHMLKNQVMFGEPLAPFILFEEPTWIHQVRHSPEDTRWLLMTYPLAIVFGRYPMQGGTLSVLVLVLLPLTLLLPRPKVWWESLLVQLVLVAPMGIVLWMIARPSFVRPRHILIMLLFFTLFVARGAEYALHRQHISRWFHLHWVIPICIIIALLPRLYEVRFSPSSLVAYFQEEISECEWTGLDCSIATMINQQAQPGDRIFNAEMVPYFLRPDLLQCMNSSAETKVYNLSSPQSWKYLYDHGFRYVLVHEILHERVEQALDLDNVPEWMDVVTLYDTYNFYVFRLDVANPPGEPSLSCQQIKPPVWTVVANEEGQERLN